MNNQILLSKIANSLINSYSIFKLNSTLGEFILNYVKLDTQSRSLINEKSNKKLIMYLLINYFLPVLNDVIRIILKKLNFTKSLQNMEFLNKLMSFLHLLIEYYFKIRYIFSSDFTYFSFVDFLFNYMTINKGSTGSFSDKFLNIGKQINLFLLFIFIRLGEWYYSKDTSENKSIQIETPVVEKTEKHSIRTGNEYENENMNLGKVLFHKGKCFICGKRPNNDELLVLICCGMMFCETCYKIKINKIREHKSLSDQFICPICSKFITDTSFVKLYP